MLVVLLLAETAESMGSSVALQLQGRQRRLRVVEASRPRACVSQVRVTTHLHSLLALRAAFQGLLCERLIAVTSCVPF